MGVVYTNSIFPSSTFLAFINTKTLLVHAYRYILYASKPSSVHTLCIVSLSSICNVNALKIAVNIPGALRCCNTKMLQFLKGRYWTNVLKCWRILSSSRCKAMLLLNTHY